MKSESKNGSGSLSRAQILAAADVKIEAVEVPEWGGTVHVRNMSGKGRDEFESSRYKFVNGAVEIVQTNTRAELLARSLCDETGKLLFSVSDVAALGDKGAEALDKCFAVAQRLSGLRDKELEERLKNSVGVPSGSSGTS